MTDTTPDHRQTTWQLARLAECADPDRHDGQGLTPTPDPATVDPSPGATFLRHVEDGARELYDRLRVDYSGDGYDWPDHVERWADYSGGVHEIADGAPDVYTYTRWREFVDLGAWEEDPSELMGGEGSDLTGAAGVALYMIAERLAWALLREWAEDEDWPPRCEDCGDVLDGGNDPDGGTCEDCAEVTP